MAEFRGPLDLLPEERRDARHAGALERVEAAFAEAFRLAGFRLLRPALCEFDTRVSESDEPGEARRLGVTLPYSGRTAHLRTGLGDRLRAAVLRHGLDRSGADLRFYSTGVDLHAGHDSFDESAGLAALVVNEDSGQALADLVGGWVDFLGRLRLPLQHIEITASWNLSADGEAPAPELERCLREFTGLAMGLGWRVHVANDERSAEPGTPAGGHGLWLTIWAGAGEMARGLVAGCCEVRVEQLPTPPARSFLAMEAMFSAEALAALLDALDIGGAQLSPPVVVAYADAGVFEESMRIALELRAVGIPARIVYRAKNFAAQFREADRLGAAYVVLVGGSEWDSGQVSIRDFATREERAVARGEAVAVLRDLYPKR